MKIAKQSRSRHPIGRHASSPAPEVDGPSPAVEGPPPAASSLSVPAIVAGAFGRFDGARRAQLLGRLLGSVGPLALAVVGGGVFAKFLPSARLPVVPVSFEDAALATSTQVYELVRYVEQSNPNLVEGVLTSLLQDGMTMTALGASIVAVGIKQIADRSGPSARARRRAGRDHASV